MNELGSRVHKVEIMNRLTNQITLDLNELVWVELELE